MFLNLIFDKAFQVVDESKALRMDPKSKEKTPKQGKTSDIPLRKLLKELPTKFLNLLGIYVNQQKVKFLDVKLPKLFEREADLVFEHQGNIYHIEI